MRIPPDYLLPPSSFLLFLFLALLLPGTVGHSCRTAVDNGWIDWRDGVTWTTCYQSNDGHVAGRTQGSLSMSWFGQSGSWSPYNYNGNISFYHADSRYRGTSCGYHQTGTCLSSTCCCGGCNRDCYNSYWSNGDLYYRWRKYFCVPARYVAIYHPCHPYCTSCNARWNNERCDTCSSYSNGVKVYQWLSYPGTTNRTCHNYCPDRNYDNAYEGQYIASTSDSACSWCNSTCSKCENFKGGANCRTCVSWAYLLASYSLCVTTFPYAGDNANCHPDYYCVSPCPNNLYFEVPQSQTATTKYDWSKNNPDTNIQATNICYLCHRYCFTCTDKFDSTCSACAYSYFKWQQSFYGNRCNYFCNEGNYTAGGLVGEYVDPVFGADPHRRCALCDSGCKYCSGTASTCYVCQDDHYLLDDKAACLATFTCAQCQASGSGGIVTDGCHTVDKYCRPSTCPTFFYFKVFRTGSGDYSSTNAKYFYFTEAASTSNVDNKYASNTDPRYTNTSEPSPAPNTNIHYRKITNFCKLCDFRCMKCTGPTNFECSLCVNNYYKWTNDTVCESYCPVGQFQQNISTGYPNNETTCANCDVKCISCQGYNNNCSACTVFPFTNYAFLYTYVVYNATCMTTCPASTTPLTTKGFYGSIGSMICYACPGGCSNCNIDYVRQYYTILQNIVCNPDYKCTEGIVCTSCLSGYSLVGGTCVDQTTCRLYSYYVQGTSSTTWSPSNCKCLEGYYFSDGTSCSLCHMDCLTCNGPASSNCLTCHEGYVQSSGSCVNSQITRKDYFYISGGTVSNGGQVGTDYNNYQWCGTNYYTLFGYRSGFTTSREIYYNSPSIASINYYAISVKVRILFVDQWESTAGIYFRLGSVSAYPFFVYNYDNKGAIGQMQCGTAANDYLLTINAKTDVAPTGTTSWTVYLNSIKNPVQNSTGFYYYWGLHDAVFSILRCHSSCATCTGPLASDCKTCADSQKEVVNGTCLCRVTSNFYYTYGAVSTAGCNGGCPTCTYSAGNPSTGCYYRDKVRRMCINPPTVNCSAPYLYGQPYQLTNSYGTCVQNCSSGYYAIQSLMKCTSNCAQFSLYYYRGASALGSRMDKCVSVCPSGLIADPSTSWCVSRCPTNWYYKLENRNTNPMCTNNCTTGYEYDNMNECVTDCPSGYFFQVVSTHNKCVQTCSNSFGDNITLDCVLFCPTPSFADPVLHLCVQECTNSQYEQVSIANGNRTCVTVCQNNQWLHPYYLNCSRDPLDCPVGFFADNHTHKCERTCSVLGEVGQNSTRLCQTGCNTGFAYWAAKMCVSECPSSPAMFSYVSGSTRICVSSCNSSSTHLFGDAQANRSCVATCSSSPVATFGNYGTNLCVERCPVSNQYGDPNHANRHCVTNCATFPAQTYAYSVTKLCVSTCPEGYFGDNYTTTGLGICATGCPSPYYGDITSMLCVSKCAYHYYGTQTGLRLCTLVCPSGWYGINQTSNRVCTQTCDSGYWADNFTRLCYNTKTLCSNNTYADAQLRYCVNGTDCTAGTYADPKTMGCESACTNSSYFGDPSTNLCVTLCPTSPDYYSQSGYCTASCTGGQFADWQNSRSCVATCSSSPVSLYGTTTYRCVTAGQCWSTFSTFGNNNTRLCSLCSGSLPFGDPVSRQCVADCPLTYYGDTTTNLCVLTCDFTRKEYADNATGQCTTYCTLGTFGVNDTAKPICQLDCPPGSYALDSIRVCVLNCGPGFFGDPITNQCYSSALNCSEGYFGNSVTHMCVLPADCQTATTHFYADNDTKLCIQKCLSPYYGLNTTYTCELRCAQPYYGENTTRICLNKAGCGVFLSYADDQLDLCVAVCSSAPVFTYAQNQTYSCVVPADCPNNMYAQNTTQSCVFYCPHDTVVFSFADSFKTKRCLATCFDAYYGETVAGYGWCTSTCTGTNYFKDNRTQLCTYTCSAADTTLGLAGTFGDSTTDQCVPQCPSGWYAQSQINRTCVVKCQDGTWGNQVTRVCITNPVTDCPSGTWADSFVNLCVSFCTANTSNSQVFYGQNITKMCVAACPVPSFAYQVTRVCIDICPFTIATSPGLFGDPSTLPTRLCVPVCLTSGLYRDVANNRTCQPTCTYNSTFKTYRDPTTMTCLAECPTYPQYLYAQGTTSATAECAASCPSGQYKYDGNTSCLSSCPALLDPTLGKCVDVCPFNSASNTVLYANLITNICVAAADCPASTYASDDSLQCVGTCPSGTYISGKHCVYYCPDGTYINPSNQSCVAAANCPFGFYGNNQTRTCVSACTNGTFADDGTKMCLTTCYGSNYGDYLTGKCSTSCSAGLIKNNSTFTCIASCITGTFFNPLTSSCQSTCPSPYFADSTSHLCVSRCSSDPLTFAAETPTRSCVTTCPSSAAWFNLVSRVCTSICPSGTYKYPLNVSCVSFCPSPYYLQADTCVLDCSSSSTYADDTTRTCVSGCPLGYYKDPTTFKCVLNCPHSPSTYYASDVTKSCVLACTTNTYADPQNFKCVSVCSTNPVVYYAEPNTLTCVKICPSAYNQFSDPTTQKCVTTCPSGYFADNRERKCLQSCGNTFWADSLTNPPSCVSVCTSLTYADPLTFRCETSCSSGYYALDTDNTCVKFCPFGLFADPSSLTCKSQCNSATHQYADSFTHTCTGTCSNQQFAYKPVSAFNGSCLHYCPGGYFADSTTMTCVVKCPSGYFGQTTNNTCMPTCEESKFADAVNNLCQTTCPSLDGLFGEPFARKCVTNCSLEGKDFLYADTGNRLCTELCSAGTYADPATRTCVASAGCSGGLFSDPYYSLCVSRCYNETYSYAGACHSACPASGTYADEASQSCVTAANCAAGLFADPTKGKCVPHCDIASGRYANAASRTCQTGCSSPLFADNITRTCASLCTSVPQYYGLNSSRLCVMNCPANSYGDASLNLCVVKCADGSFGDDLTWSCVKTCPEGYFGDNSTNKCVATCPSTPVYFGDFYTSTCVLSCSNSQYADAVSNRECVEVCASPNFAENSTMTCQGFCSTGFADPTTRQCIAQCSTGYYGHSFVCHQYQCPAATPIVYADDSTRLCVTQCPQGTYGQPNTRKCVPVCPIAYSEFADTTNRVCRTSCLTGTFADESRRQCVATCSSTPALFSYSSGNLCLPECPNGLYADNSTRSCSPSCPSGTYADNSTYRCVSVCPTKPMMFGTNLTNTCVYSCSVSFDRYADNASRTCVINCPLGTFADPVSRTCVDTCQSGYYAVNSTRRCQTNCPSGQFANPLSRVCVAVCPVDPILYGDEVSWTCLGSCPTGAYGNPLTQRCVYDAVTVSGCPPNYYSQANSNLCVEVCPMKFDLYADPTTKSCRSSCPAPYLADNSTMRCVLTCPSYPNYFANTNTLKCVLFCPNETWADDSSRVCVSACPNNSYAENSTWRCVGQCLNEPMTLRDSSNWQCVSQCPSGYFADYFNLLCVASCPTEGDGFARNDTRECVKTCPSGSFAYLPTRTCVLTCYGNTYADSTSWQCVDVCPRYPALYADNTTMNCVGECPSGMFAYDHSRECIIDCPVGLGYYRQNSTKTCVLACDYSTNTYADNSTGYCVTQCSSGFFADPSTKKCVSICPDQPLMYAQNTTRVCVATCPTDTFGQNKTRVCVAACPSGSLSYPQNTLCVFECPIGYYAYIPTQFCVSICPQPYYGDPSTRTCVAVCPINQLLYADNSTRTCVQVCPSGSYAYQWDIACLPSCPVAVAPYVQTYAADYDNTCTEQCAFPYFSYDPTFRCVSQCPDPYYNKIDTHTCERCPLSCTTCNSASNCFGCVLGYFLQSGACVTACTLIYYANPTTRECVISTGCAPSYGVNATHTCESTCPNGQYANPTTYRCDLCPSTCVSCTTSAVCSTCITASVSHNNFCYGYCNFSNPAGTGMFYNPDNITCTAVCPDGSYSSVVYCKSCASQCSTCVDLDTKCTNCSNGKYIFNFTCVDQCPAQYKPVSSRACEFCGTSCGSGLTYSTNVTTINGQDSLFVNFDASVDITGNLYSTFEVTTTNAKRRLLQTSTPSYQIVIIDANTVQIIFPPGTSQSNYNFQIINPQNVVGPNGQLPASLSAQIAMDVSNQYSTSVSEAPSSFSTYFLFLSFICLVSFLFDLQLMRFLQLLYVHYFVIMALPPHLFKVFNALRFSTIFYLPRIFSVTPAVLHPDVPDTVYNMVGDYNFLRNAGFALTPLVVILGVWGILKLLSVPQINKFKNVRVWCRAAMEKRFKFAILLEWVFLFITNTVFFAFLQLRDYNIYDTFAQVGLVLAHFFILFFVVLSVMVAYKVISFQKEHPQMSQNIKKASEIILQDDQVDQLVSTNVFLSERKKIDLRDIYYPQVNNQNIFPFRCVYRFSFLALMCPNVLYLRVILLSVFIALAKASVQTQMGLAIPLNVLALLYFCKARPYSFKFRKFRIKNYIVIYHEVCLIIFQFLMLTLGIKDSAGASALEKEQFANYIIYYLTAVCTISFVYQIFVIGVFLYRKVWLRFIETELFIMNFPDLHAKYQARKNKNKKLAKKIDPKAKEALKSMIKGYKKSKSVLRPNEQDKANPQLPLKYKITYFDRTQTSSAGSRTTLSRRQKKQMLNEIFGKQEREIPKDEEQEFGRMDEMNEDRDTIGPDYEEYEEQIEIRAKDLAKYVSNSEDLLKMKKAEL